MVMFMKYVINHQDLETQVQLWKITSSTVKVLFTTDDSRAFIWCDCGSWRFVHEMPSFPGTLGVNRNPCKVPASVLYLKVNSSLFHFLGSNCNLYYYKVLFTTHTYYLFSSLISWKSSNSKFIPTKFHVQDISM